MVMETSREICRNDTSYDNEILPHIGVTDNDSANRMSDLSVLDDNDSTVDAQSLQERLAAYALAVSGNAESRKGVWGEHSYARARGASAHDRVRTLLAPRTLSPPPTDVDVLSVSPEPPAVPGDAPASADEDDDDGEEDDWERRLRALAPSAAHARLADEALDTLRALRLQRLAGAGAGRWARRDGARAAARRLRRALAPHWAGGAGWLHAALTAQLPRAQRALYRELLQELRRAAPRLAARLPLARPLDRVRDPLAAVPEAVPAEADGPWLAWAPSGDAAADRRWTRRLGALLHTRLLSAEAARGPPERWVAAVGGAARASLERLRAEAGGRALALGGVGAGAALAAWLAGGARAVRLLLLAPPLQSAEGAREGAAEAAQLLVVGGGAASCWRGAALEQSARARVLLLSDCDDALRLPRRHRRRLGLPQHALDAAVAEECARWLLDAEEARAGGPGGATPPPPHKEPPSEDEVAPPTTPARAIEIVEGRVMRVSGATALTLRPRREPLAPADILQLPIVFADDALAVAPPGPAPARRGVRRGGARPRLLLAKRGRRA